MMREVRAILSGNVGASTPHDAPLTDGVGVTDAQEAARPPSVIRVAGVTVIGEETVMAKSKKGSRKAEPAENTQKFYARAYASRLAKQVGEEPEVSRRTTTPRKKPRAKR
jgi:hypothetical protein